MSVGADPTSLVTALPALALGGASWTRWPLVLVAAIVLVHVLRRREGPSLLQLAREVLIVVSAYFLYFLVRGFVDGRELEAFQRGADIIHFEKALGMFWEPDLQSLIMPFDSLINAANWVYVWGHWPVIVIAAIWLFLLHRESYTLYRNAFLISGAIGLLVFALYPVAPPRFMDGFGFVDTLTDRSTSYRVLQPPAFVNQYAAMPSLHFGWNLLVGIAIARHGAGSLAKVFGFAFPAFMFAAIVLTANHYIVDGLAGGALALVGLLAANSLDNFSRPTTGGLWRRRALERAPARPPIAAGRIGPPRPAR